jgi:hypothetical protein
MEKVIKDQSYPASKSSRKVLAGIFIDRISAERAYNLLLERGYTNDDIHLMMSEETRSKHFSGDAPGSEVEKKAEVAGKTGVAIGGAAGAVAGIATVVAAGLTGPGILIAGPVAAGIAGAATGGVIGVMTTAGIPEEKASVYESGIKDGKIFMSVFPKNDKDADDLENDWRNNNVEEIHR